MSWLLKTLPDFELYSTGKWFLLAAIVGVAAGTGAVAFQTLGQAIEYVMFEKFTGFEPGGAAVEHALFSEATDSCYLGLSWR